MHYEQIFLISLLLTLAAEVPVVTFFIKSVYKQKEVIVGEIIFTATVASCLTLPYLWFVLPFYVHNQTAYVLGGESAIALVEAVIYYQFLRLDFPKALVVSMVANTASVILGWYFFKA